MNRNSNQVQHFQVIPIAFVVAYENNRGELVAVSEHISANTAAHEARQLNNRRTAAFETKTNRAARYFDTDASAFNGQGA